jgi:hypothetical protein
MKLVFGAALLLLSFKVFAEDVYDRINACEKQEDRGCVSTILRELAVRVEKIEKGEKPFQAEDLSKLCAIGISDEVAEILHVNDGVKKQLGSGYIVATPENLIEFRRRWEYLNCGKQSKVHCQISDDGFVVEIERPRKIGFLMDIKDGKIITNPRHVLKGLQKTICLE